MLTDHIASLIVSKFTESLTPSQERLVHALAGFTLSREEDVLMVVSGYAGTGKTTMISAYVEMLNEIKMKSVLLAPTGRAAKVLTAYSGCQAYTIHKKIYRQQSSRDGMGKFFLDRNLHSRTIFIVDEASMISNEQQVNSVFGTGCLLDDLIEYVYNEKECKLILVGDTAQLPPIGLILSPALSAKNLGLYSETIIEEELREVVRQQKKSGILHHATLIRRKIDDHDFSLPVFDSGHFPDVERISGDQLLETLSSCYERYGMNETIVISRSNKRANKYNAGIRQTILYREEELVPGDLLMVVKNNYYWLKVNEELDFIANGDIVEVIRVRRFYELYGFRYAECTIRLIDYDTEIEAKLLLDVLTEEAPALSNEKNKMMFFTILEDYTDIKQKKKQYEQVRNNEYFNAIQVKYAYAVTCHKSQGGQWKAVFIDHGYLTAERIDLEYLRWLYTAITRATEKVYLVNFSDFMFEEQ
jgi:exodeoxyribonuclease V